jgi:cell division septum initiation protein DivIVA
MISLLSLMLTASADDALADWVPPKVLVAALLAFLSASLTIFGVAIRALLKRLDKLETAVEAQTDEARELRAEISKLSNFATREHVTEMLGNMGNRFDERMAKLREDNARLEVRLARLEARAPRRAKA